jgi:UDP-2,3-diacylglucosamine pyrophosphatase LpxH
LQKIKLVVSDFHLGKGRLDEHGHINDLEDFYEDQKFIEFLNHYSGRRTSDDEVELILNGDFFELLVVDGQDQVTNRETEQTVLWKIQKIFQGHKDVFDALWAFGARPGNRIAFIVGNHDAGLLWPQVQRAVIQRLGPSTRIFESVYNTGPIHIAHGNHHEFIHAYNTHNFSYRNASGQQIFRMPWGALFVMEFLSPLKKDRPYVDKVKPFRLYLKYALLNDHFFFWKTIVGLIRFWMRNRFSRDPVRRREFSLSPGRLKNALTHESMDKSAYKILKNTNFRYVIFGHSHKYQHRRYGGYGEYLNTGTWNEVISLELPDLGRHVDRTFVLIDCTDEEKPILKLKRWLGTHLAEEDVIA